MRIPALLVALCVAACGAPQDDTVDLSVEALTTDGGSASPIGQWVWHDVPGTMCANGSPTGVGINRGTGSKVVVYMSGGSACLDSSCSIGTPSMRKNGGFGATQLSACVQGSCDGSVTFPSKSIFNRTSTGASPFTDATYVFISNCSGDYYVGNADHAFSSWTARFHGSQNQQLIATALKTWFPAASRVVLTGGSAGAVGALLNYWQWVAAFPNTRVDLIADSFAFVFSNGPQWRYSLHNPQVPPGCPTCATDYRTVYAFNANLSPSSRIAILDSENNFTLDFATGYQYTQGLAALQPLLDALPNTKYHVADGNVHILMQYALNSTYTDIVESPSSRHYVSDFLAKMQSNDPTWTSHTSVP